jgi:hypothetical protein
MILAMNSSYHSVLMISVQWILVPQDVGTFKIQSAMFPNMFISYAAFGSSSTSPIHSQLVLRGNANAAIFSLQTLAGGQTVK